MTTAVLTPESEAQLCFLEWGGFWFLSHGYMWKNFTDRIRNTDVHGVFIKPKTYACICSLNDVGGGSVIWWVQSKLQTEL